MMIMQTIFPEAEALDKKIKFLSTTRTEQNEQIPPKIKWG